MLDSIRFENLRQITLYHHENGSRLAFDFEGVAEVSQVFEDTVAATELYGMAMRIAHGINDILAVDAGKKTIQGLIKIRACVARGLGTDSFRLKHSEIIQYMGLKQEYPSLYFRRVENALDGLKLAGDIDHWICDKKTLRKDYLYVIKSPGEAGLSPAPGAVPSCRGHG